MRNTHADPDPRRSPRRDPRIGVGLITLVLGLALVAAGLPTLEPIVAFENRQAQHRWETAASIGSPPLRWEREHAADGWGHHLDASNARAGNRTLVYGDAWLHAADRGWRRAQLRLSLAWRHASGNESDRPGMPERGKSELCTSGTISNPGAPC